jgi:hypothetical protein
MKNFIFLLVVLLLICGQSHAQSALLVNVKDCREENQFESISEIRLFRNDTLINTIKSLFNTGQPISDLKYGKYRIDFETIFNRTESVYIELSEQKTYSIDLCISYLAYDLETYVPMIDQIQDGESYSIHCASNGCFHSREDLLIIGRKAGYYFLKFEGRKKLLSRDEEEAIRHFEYELNYMESDGCTTSEVYTLKYKGNEVKIRDGSCDWNGAYHLKRQLNLTKE